MNIRSCLLLAAVPIALIGGPATAGTATQDAATDPMRFFEGRTESVATVKVIMHKPFRSRSVGQGEISDGVLSLVQQVQDEGKEPYDRRWRMRQVGPGTFAGTMSEAMGPVIAEAVDGQYVFRFKMKGHLTIEQWLTPLPGGRAAHNKINVRKFGMTVAQSEGTIRKI